jgi:hypothetical protein
MICSFVQGVVLLDTSNTRRKTDLGRLAKSSSLAVRGLRTVAHLISG